MTRVYSSHASLLMIFESRKLGTTGETRTSSPQCLQPHLSIWVGSWARRRKPVWFEWVSVRPPDKVLRVGNTAASQTSISTWLYSHTLLTACSCYKKPPMDEFNEKLVNSSFTDSCSKIEPIFSFLFHRPFSWDIFDEFSISLNIFLSMSGIPLVMWWFSSLSCILQA